MSVTFMSPCYIVSPLLLSMVPHTMCEGERTMCEILGVALFLSSFNVFVGERVKGCCSSVKRGDSGV